MKFNSSVVIFIFFGLLAHADNFTRKTEVLSSPGLIGGIPVQAGKIEVFEPGETLASGTLAADFDLELLHLPAGTALNMISPEKSLRPSFQSHNLSTCSQEFPSEAARRSV